ncbi:hypothetical protein [Myxococcus landrumensis]|uniref:SnoaL-like domain-containing protein n=1 Tax=Myxococcus landrumensis TaxID=2813577 RepID=A0ABX7NGF7_9BACT|nr:hypothetical protein [Myxococcus landrumus]QSQ17733.1 hypothetical protein JY572_17600 [Myxococcus landrumus]
MSMNEVCIASDPDSARALLERHGGLDDCFVERVTQDFRERWIEVVVDDLYRGKGTATSSPGMLLFRSIDYLLCRIPFVGGRVRVESCEIGEHQGKIKARFGFTTTEWLNEAEFSVVELVLVCGSIEVRRLDESIVSASAQFPNGSPA